MPQAGTHDQNWSTQLDPNVRIVLATGFSQRDPGDLLRIPSVRDFLQKPFMLQELADLLKNCLD